ncbi:MAG: dephospho-CoA kinase [Sporomusa sp.]
MYLIGLTGGIASGKSTVSKMLSELGAYIVDADKITHEITEPGKPAWHDIVATFGQAITDSSGHINRKRLGTIIFADPKAKARLELITHPRIAEEAMIAVASAQKQGYKVIVLDAPLLIEAKWHTYVDAIWLVYINEKTQVIRLMLRDNCSYETAMSKINAQLSLQEKLKYANVVIDNSKTIGNTKKQVIKAWNEINAIGNPV